MLRLFVFVDYVTHGRVPESAEIPTEDHLRR